VAVVAWLFWDLGRAGDVAMRGRVPNLSGRRG
jgi:hypothetical protein